MERVKREFVVERHAVTSVVIYEVTGEDLEQLEKETLTVGEDFSFALAATAIAVSFMIKLSTVVIRAGAWAHYMRWTWLLDTERTPDQVVEALRPHVQAGDKLLISPLTRPYQGLLTKEGWAWVNARSLPAESKPLGVLQWSTRDPSVQPA